MKTATAITAGRVSAETSASADLDAVCRWLTASQGNPVHLDVEDLPALGQDARLRLALPVTGPRAILCTLLLVEDIDAGATLLAGQLRFVAHPTAPDMRLSFTGHIAAAVRTSSLRHNADHTARQLLELIARFVERPPALSPSPA
ncbi:MAG: hypothetical protein AUJ02_09850 [Chloroflexi bacterium 13_1_40CM_3_65_12]|nr:MAG: hypothetical protein AUH69_08745 [Actinobacteria bacterium 13_1_40CM_4_65_12]OLD23740.1 MAG: hypothetical protein AUJ02_09850 [Chloroflexi bacterium 13_1_40CM_3_65_12]